MSTYPLIEAEKAEGGNVAKACTLLEVSRSAYYEWSKHRPSRRQLADAELADKIAEVFDASRGTYGWPRVHAALRRGGICASRKRVARLMAQAGLVGRCRRKKTRTTFSDPEAKALDLIKRAFGPGTELDRTWVGDITYSAQFSVMCSLALHASSSWWFSTRWAAHNHRCSRKAKRRSGGRNRVGPGFGSVNRWSTASLVARSASRYWWVTAGLECPSHRAMTARSAPDSSRWTAVECRRV